MSINVKEKADGNFFYSFSAERAEKNGEPSTPRTLHAVVNSNGEVAANGNLSNTTVTPEGKVVKTESAEALDIEVDEKTESALADGQLLYSDRDSESISNRSLLANALESTVKNDIERKRLEEYRS